LSVKCVDTIKMPNDRTMKRRCMQPAAEAS
jgi:hypothetical protein